MEEYEMATKKTEKIISGPDEWRKTVPDYQTTAMLDRLSHRDFYTRMMRSHRKLRSTRPRKETEAETLEYEEGDLQIQIQRDRDKYGHLREFWKQCE